MRKTVASLELTLQSLYAYLDNEGKSLPPKLRAKVVTAVTELENAVAQNENKE